MDNAAFIDDRNIAWSQVRRTRAQFYQRFHYAYPGPIQQLRQRLIVIPADQYGAQRLCSHTLLVNPLADATRQQTDIFGNRILELEVSEAGASISFEVMMTVETEAHTSISLTLAPAAVRRLLQSTPLTRANTRMRGIAQQLWRETSDGYALAQRISEWVYGVMRYENGVTTVESTAAEALALGRGLCQDYSHIMLALCRQVGLPARYVSGHLMGEAGSHAWVEVLLPTATGFDAFAFDPTNNCHPDLSYITVAVGRDYRDVSPTSGTFVAPYSGQLTSSKRAGLTYVEYFNGDVLTLH